MHRLSIWTTALSLLALFAGCVASSGGSSPRTSDAQRAAALRSAGPFTMGGEWSGLFMNGMEFVRVDLALDTPPALENGKEVFTGTADYRSWSPSGDAGIRGASSASATVRVVYEPASGGFTLEVQRVLSQQGNGGLAQRFRDVRGVADTVHQRLAGMHGNMLRTFTQCFRFTRPDEFEASTAVYERFAGPGPKVAPKHAGMRRGGLQTLGALFGAGPDKPEVATVVAWSRRVREDVPARGGRRHGVGLTGVSHAELMSLFEDEHFATFFGAPYDGLSDDALDGIHALLRQDLMSSADAEEKSIGGIYQLFKRSDQGSPTGVQTLQAVLCMRTVRHWLAESSRRLTTLPPGEEGWELARGMQAELESPLAAMFWPSEIDAGLRSVDAGLGTQAYAALARGLDVLERQPRNDETLRALMDWPFRTMNDRRGIDSNGRVRLEERRFAIMDDLLDDLLVPRRASMPALGDGLATVVAGAAWYHGLHRDFARTWERPPLRRLRDEFLTVRPEALAAAQPEMDQQVLGLKLVQLPLVSDAWFSVPSDRDGAVYADIVEAVARREATIDAAILAAEERARELVSQDPTKPLPFLDVRRYAAPDFLEFVYYGEGDDIDAGQMMVDWLEQADANKLLANSTMLQHLEASFRIYHSLYYDRYGKTEAMREARLRSHGERWGEIRSVWVEKDDWGNVISTSDRGVQAWVRDPYREKYIECEQTEGDLWGSLFIGLLASGQDDEAAAAHVQETFALGGLNLGVESTAEGSARTDSRGVVASREEYRALFEAFLDEHLAARIATVRHLEHNLMALVSGQPLRKVARLPVDGL